MAGQRPRSWAPTTAPLYGSDQPCSAALPTIATPRPVLWCCAHSFGWGPGHEGSPVAYRHPSMFSAPVPCSSTFAATVPVSGLRARMAGSMQGLRAVPQPSHWAASGVAGAVSGHDSASSIFPYAPLNLVVFLLRRAALGSAPTTFRSAPAALSIAFDTSSDLGNPELPVTNTLPRRLATNAPVGTVTHQTTPR